MRAAQHICEFMGILSRQGSPIYTILPILRFGPPFCAAKKLLANNPSEKSLKIDFPVNNQFLELCVFYLAAPQQSYFSTAGIGLFYR
jgi:hypothetical protein